MPVQARRQGQMTVVVKRRGSRTKPAVAAWKAQIRRKEKGASAAGRSALCLLGVLALAPSARPRWVDGIVFFCLRLFLPLS